MPVLIRHLWQLKTVVCLHWYLICAVLLLFPYEFLLCLPFHSCPLWAFVRARKSALFYWEWLWLHLPKHCFLQFLKWKQKMLNSKLIKTKIIQNLSNSDIDFFNFRHCQVQNFKISKFQINPNKTKILWSTFESTERECESQHWNWTKYYNKKFHKLLGKLCPEL